MAHFIHGQNCTQTTLCALCTHTRLRQEHVSPTFFMSFDVFGLHFRSRWQLSSRKSHFQNDKNVRNRKMHFASITWNVNCLQETTKRIAYDSIVKQNKDIKKIINLLHATDKVIWFLIELNRMHYLSPVNHPLHRILRY